MNIKKILEEHKLWLNTDGTRGERADFKIADLQEVDLRGADLRGADLERADLIRVDLRDAYLQGADLRKADLRGADLRGAYLQRADLRGANLQEVDLQGADFRKAYLQGTNLQGANLQRAHLWGADLQEANLHGADLQEVDLRGADLRGANLRGANLEGADLQEAYLEGANLQGADLTDCKLPNYSILPKGDLIVYKKVRDDIILELLISRETKRVCSLIGRKCRAQAVKVLSAWDASGEEVTDKEHKFYSMHDYKFKYQIGSIVEVADFDDDIRVECTKGIHFFVTKEEASNYK